MYKFMEGVRNLTGGIMVLMGLITLLLFFNDNGAWLVSAVLAGLSGWACSGAQDWLDRRTYDCKGYIPVPVYERRRK